MAIANDHAVLNLDPHRRYDTLMPPPAFFQLFQMHPNNKQSIGSSVYRCIHDPCLEIRWRDNFQNFIVV